MKQMTLGTFTLALALVALQAPAQLQAQEPMGHQPMAMADHCPMLGMPGMVLMYQDDLDLTPQQVSRLETMHAEMQRGQGQLMERTQDMQRRAAHLTGAEEFDRAAARSVAREAAELHEQLMMHMLEARHQVGQVLEPGQMERLRGMHREMHREQPGMEDPAHMGMMMNCPMMHGHTGDGPPHDHR